MITKRELKFIKEELLPKIDLIINDGFTKKINNQEWANKLNEIFAEMRIKFEKIQNEGQG